MAIKKSISMYKLSLDFYVSTKLHLANVTSSKKQDKFDAVESKIFDFL